MPHLLGEAHLVPSSGRQRVSLAACFESTPALSFPGACVREALDELDRLIRQLEEQIAEGRRLAEAFGPLP
jgi:hypothetical protein